MFAKSLPERFSQRRRGRYRECEDADSWCLPPGLRLRSDSRGTKQSSGARQQQCHERASIEGHARQENGESENLQILT